MLHRNPEAYASPEQVFRLYDNISAWMLAHCGEFTWSDPEHNLGTYGDSTIPLTSGLPPKQTFGVSFEAIQAHAPEMIQEFRINTATGLSLYQMPESYQVTPDEEWLIDSEIDVSSFGHIEPQLNIVCNMPSNALGRPSEHLIFRCIEREYCEVIRQYRAILASGESMAHKPRMSDEGANIITKAEIAALGKLTDMLYLYGPDATRYKSPEA